MNVVVELAGIVVAIECVNEQVKNFFKKYESDKEAELKISVNQSDIEREKRLSAEHDPRSELPDRYYEILAIHRKFCSAAIKKQVLLFHSSSIAVDKEAYLFTAPSGTGKSTHARLWREMLGERAVMINDDKPFLRFKDNNIYVYGSPWSGKHRLDSNICVPLKGVCVLEQALENHIERLTANDSFARLSKQVYFPDDRTQFVEVIKLIGQLSKAPIYLMKCNISKEAAYLSYRAMKEGE